jgi:hypothetical protein
VFEGCLAGWTTAGETVAVGAVGAGKGSFLPNKKEEITLKVSSLPVE